MITTFDSRISFFKLNVNMVFKIPTFYEELFNKLEDGKVRG